MKKTIYSLVAASVAIIIGTSAIDSTNHNSGASVKTNSTCTSCHSGSKAAGVAAKGSVVITGIPDTCVGGTTYPIQVIIKDAAAKSYGFNAITPDGKFAATTTGRAVTAIATTALPNRNSIHHSSKIVGTPNATDSTYTISGMTWTAPTTAGAITVSIGALATNNNAGSSGDHAYSSTLKTIVTVDSTLPIKLASFNANASMGKVNLTWSTSTETNVASFAIERSVDGKGFVNAGKVSAAGNTTSAHTYSFIDDASKLSGVVYYRLKTIDKDGKSAYSSVQQVVLKASKSGITNMYPNPLHVGQDLKLNYTSIKTGTANIQLVNLLGKKVVNTTVSVNEGNNALSVAVGHLTPGIYYVTLISENASVERVSLLVK